MAGQQRRHAQGLTATPGRHFHGLRRSVWCVILRLSCAQRSVTEALQSGDIRVAERPSPAGNLAGTLKRYVEFWPDEQPFQRFFDQGRNSRRIVQICDFEQAGNDRGIIRRQLR
ncbi:hypothetical protein [Sinorhizobium sp. GL28]|uniref:hypothetical protein n=1 Tax=Sinorhizobium sp. GL28 TaxID=1358418 RepID=UPI0018D204A0|nr:hypothetical protein [Sinorhizobium sp. GL28]